jgi:hypothetical protein
MQARPAYKYSTVLLATLAAAFTAAWLLVGLAAGLPGVATFARNLAISLFLGILATVLWLDYWGYATLRGLIDWRTTHGWKRVGLVCLLILFPVVVGVYLVRAVVDYRRPRTAGPRSATPPTRFRTTPIGLATLGGVTLLALVISTVGAQITTGVASAQGPSTSGGQDNTSPIQPKPKATSTQNSKPAKGQKGRGHHPHHG